MIEPARFTFTDADPGHIGVSLMPILPLTLTHGNQEVAVSGLLDTGAAVNVLPFSVGLQLGFTWEHQGTPVVLTGNLARVPARGIVILATVAHFPPVRLAFAWSQSDDIRLLLGQANFFIEYDVCFFRTRARFEVSPSTARDT
jgi:hypothetical protein